MALFSVLQNGDAALGNYQKLSAWMRGDAQYTGTWWNGDGDVIDDGRRANGPDELVWLSITSNKGRLEGVIHSPRLCNYLPWPYVQFVGENTWLAASGRLGCRGRQRSKYCGYEARTAI
ncbi:MAG: hypothetical protein JWL62_726 [Hyphomicrobiales bacterium]|nr:hypothetical protein [Hyphomicrobiales bacterium]